MLSPFGRVCSVAKGPIMSWKSISRPLKAARALTQVYAGVLDLKSLAAQSFLAVRHAQGKQSLLNVALTGPRCLMPWNKLSFEAASQASLFTVVSRVSLGFPKRRPNSFYLPCANHLKCLQLDTDAVDLGTTVEPAVTLC